MTGRESVSFRGEELMREATQLVLDVLRRHREGLTNAEVGEMTGLNLNISAQRGYVTWTILQWLMERGNVVKQGRTYRLTER